jgi:hypothetical protein
MFSLVLYGLTPFLIPPPPDHVPPDIAAGQIPVLVVILAVAAIALIPILLGVRKRMFFEPIGQRCQPASAEAKSAYFTMSLTSWIMCEVVGIFGFAIYFLTYELAYALPFVGLAAVLMLLFPPRPHLAEGEEPT